MQADAAFVLSLNKTKQQQKKERDYRLLHELPIKILSSGHSKNSERRSAAHKWYSQQEILIIQRIDIVNSYQMVLCHF